MIKRIGCIVLIMLTCGFYLAAEENAGLDPYNVSIAINPFSLIWGMYGIEVGIPVLNILEPTAYITFVDMFGMVRIISPDVEIPEGSSAWFVNAGVSIRFFPSQQYDSFFAGFRLTYIYLNLELEGSDVIDTQLEGSNSDIAVGFDLGWRWRWSFGGSMGMFVQTWIGMERYILQEGLTESLFVGLPIVPISALQIGFTF
ncbi:MAG: hypothetical protein JW881_13405 [Spirochaetales bacterium]|nr:hypothetical protein [Spirochaetales bacterium]